MPQKQTVHLDGREIALSNLEKVYFPENGFTKGEVIAFYTEIAETILPHLRDRPLTMKRYPDGIAAEHFYEKNAPKHTPDWVKTFAVARSEGGPDINYILCNDRATLIWVANLGDIEKHVLLARVADLNNPTSIVFDLDPGESADILDCGRVALHLKSVFDALKLESFVKVSGSKGLHLSVPLNSGAAYEVTQPFAKTVAEMAERQLPDQVVSAMSKSLRRGKVLIDWSQNSDFKTTVAVYAMRAKPGGPFISMPVTWQELARAVKSGKRESLFFTPAEAIKRLGRVGDLFAPVLDLRQSLPKAFVEALESGPPPRLSRWPRQRSGRESGLSEYAAKRDHTRTPEPAAGPAKRARKATGVHRFVVQKHEASHLHYDWRLEMEGVLRSWAVPKGPPTKPKEARLAMHVEDHPLEYATFEGTIPPGNYGAGTVMVWDQGDYEDLTGNPAAAFHAGKMHVIMRGTKLTGEWILVKDKREPESNKWLLIKAGDPVVISKKLDDTSAISGRSMLEITRANDAQWQSHRPAAQRRNPGPPSRGKTAALPAAPRVDPAYLDPMQCKPVDSLPDDDSAWTYEIKFDGFRCLAVKNGPKVTLFSRQKKSLNQRFPEIVKALGAIERDFVIDGEVVALDAQGAPSFALLQHKGSPNSGIYYYAFDLLNTDGSSLVAEPIDRRRASLAELLEAVGDPIRLSPILGAPSGHIVEAVRKLGLEGVVGKRLGSTYEPGMRSGAWIKYHTAREQEFVIGGYTPGSRAFDALLVGVYEKKKLHYVAIVKDGFLPRIRTEIQPQLEKLEVAACPFVNLPEQKSSRWREALTAEKMKGCRWVKPQLVCQVAFLEWTEAGHLRRATFVAMRNDVRAVAIVRES